MKEQIRFATPLEILPEWYFFPTFNLLRVIPNKLLGVISMAAVPIGLITVPFIENVNKFQNPFRRPLASLVFLVGTFTAFWLGFKEEGYRVLILICQLLKH